MIIEYWQLKDRLQKLDRMIVKHEAGTLDFELNCPIDLLKEQRDAMTKYIYCLLVRGEIEGMDLEGRGD